MNLLRTIFFLSMISIISSKLISRDFRSPRLRQEKSWFYLDRMQLAPGEVRVHFWVSLETQSMPPQDRYQLTLAMVPQQLWQSQIQKKCQSQHSAIQSHSQKVRQTLTISLNPNPQSYQKSSNTYIIQSSSFLQLPIHKQRTYYLVLTDCDKSMVNQYFNTKSKIQIQANIRINGHNYGADQAYYNWIIPTMMAIYGCCLYCIKKYNKGKIMEETAQETNWPVFVLRIVIWSALISLTFLFLGHIIYVLGKGNQYGFFPFMYLMVSSFTQALFLILITFFAFGWMTAYKMSDNQEIYYPIASVLGFVSVVLMMLSKINDSSPQKTHLYDSVPIIIQHFLKIIGLLIFSAGIVTFRLRYSKNTNLQSYIIRLTFLGIFCYLSMPISIILCQHLLSKHRLWMPVLMLVQGCRVLQMTILCWQMLDSKSIYGRITLHGRSFMEVGNKFL